MEQGQGSGRTLLCRAVEKPGVIQVRSDGIQDPDSKNTGQVDQGLAFKVRG